MSGFIVISWWEQVTFRRDDDDVCHLDFYSTRLLAHWNNCLGVDMLLHSDTLSIAISWWEQDNLQWDDDDVCLCACSLKQQSRGRHKGSNTGKRARRKNLRHPRERFLETNRNLSHGCLRFFRLALLPVFDSFSH